MAQSSTLNLSASGTVAGQFAPVAKGDKHLWGIYIFLCFISVIELYSASSREVSPGSFGVFGPIVRHGAMLIAGFFIIMYLQRQHYRRIFLATPWFCLISVVLMVATLVGGTTINEARRSLSFGFISIQPSEFLKISAAMLVAFIMSRTQIKGGGVKTAGVYWSAGFILFFCALLAPEGLTNTLLLMSISFSMMIIGGSSKLKLLKVGVIYLACFGLYLGVQMIARSGDEKENTEQTDSGKSGSRVGVWGSRMGSYFDGTKKYDLPMTSENQQELLGYMAQAHGGVTGVGIGNSRETSRLPLAFTDYIYAIVIEETGLIGGIVTLILYLWLLARASAIASRCSRAFPALLVIGMALVIVYQALFHICIVTGVIPVSGQPLPLISKGGTSILVTSIAFGIMLSVSRFAVRTNSSKKEIKNEIDSLPEDMRADNPTQI